MRDNSIKVLRLIEKQVEGLGVPSVTRVSYDKDPFKVLVSCLISLRTKDSVTIKASKRLFEKAGNPEDLSGLSLSTIRQTIYPAGFYRNKAKIIKNISRQLVVKYRGKVPHTAEKLLSLKGVGRKTANLVLGLAYNKPSICVDTHVHRISNRLGWVQTQTPLDTEGHLQNIFLEKYWIKINTILVSFGQNICLPVSPLCSQCSVKPLCKKIGVKYHR